MIRKLFLILCSTAYFYAQGQEEPKNPVSFALKPQYGFILPHSSKVEHLTHTNPYGFEFEAAWLMLKEKNWRQCNCYSKTGISFVYVNYDNPKVVGSSYNIIGFAEPYLYRKKNFSFSARMGVGISLLDHIYDVETNPTNTFFSTTLSYIIHVDLNAYFKLNESYSIMSYAKYNHISNGGVKQPNYGMNFPMFGVGLNYYPSGKNDFPDREKKEFSAEWFYHVYAFGMLKKIEDDPPFDEVTKINFGFLGITGRTVSLLNGFSVGLEYFYDAGAKEEIERKGINDDFNKISGLIGHHLLFGKFDFSQYWGTYIYAPYKPATFYQRYSLSYRIFPWAIAGVTLKAHGDVADSFQVILGLAI